MNSRRTAAATVRASGNKETVTVDTDPSPPSTRRVYTKNELDRLAAIIDQHTVDGKCTLSVLALAKQSGIGRNVVARIMAGRRQTESGRPAALTTDDINDIADYCAMCDIAGIPKAVTSDELEGIIRAFAYPGKVARNSIAKYKAIIIAESGLLMQRARCIPTSTINKATKEKCMQMYRVFAELWKELGDLLTREPGRLVNIDETCSSFDHRFREKTVRALGSRGKLKPRATVADGSGDSMTSTYPVAADGDMLWPRAYVLPRLPGTVEKWGIDIHEGKERAPYRIYYGERGRFDRETFLKYLEEVLKYLRGPKGKYDMSKDDLPIVIMLDNAAVHVSPTGSDGEADPLQRLASKYRARLFYFEPGTTYVAQPEDICTNGAYKSRLDKMLRAMSAVLSNPMLELTPDYAVKYVGDAHLAQQRRRAAAEDESWFAVDLRTRLGNKEPRVCFATSIQMSEEAFKSTLESEAGRERIRGAFDAGGWFPFRPKKIQSLYLMARVPWRDRLGEIDTDELLRKYSPEQHSVQTQTQAVDASSPPRMLRSQVAVQAQPSTPRVCPHKPMGDPHEWSEQDKKRALLHNWFNIIGDPGLSIDDKMEHVLQTLREGLVTAAGPVMLKKGRVIDLSTGKLPEEILITRRKEVLRNRLRQPNPAGPKHRPLLSRSKVHSRVVGGQVASAAAAEQPVMVTSSSSPCAPPAARITPLSAPSGTPRSKASMRKRAAPSDVAIQSWSNDDDGQSVVMATPTRSQSKRRAAQGCRGFIAAANLDETDTDE
jgi:hypothetical protein